MSLNSDKLNSFQNYTNHDIEYDIDADRKKLILDNFEDKNEEDISSYLFSKKASELGGITALSGFYYQLLVTIEYVIEMLEGKWDYVIMEYHDDVIVGKDKKVRYIQVKTSGETLVKINETPANGLYSRKSRKINDGKFLKLNSWVDKLFLNSFITPKKEGFESQFLLYSSYHFVKSRELDVDIYTGNKLYDAELELHPKGAIKNKLYKKLKSEDVYDDEGNKLNLESYYDESPKDLLKRFYIKTGRPLYEIDLFKNDICKKFNEFLFNTNNDEEDSNISIISSDIDHVIGYLFERCTDKTKLNRLIIKPQDLNNLISKLREKSYQKARQQYNIHESTNVFEKSINLIKEDFEESKNQHELNDIFHNYKDYLLSWVKNENGNITDLVNRLYVGTISSNFYDNIDIGIRNQSIRDLIKNSVTLTFATTQQMKFDDRDFFLTKSSVEKSYSFYAMKKMRNHKFALEDIKNIIKQKKPLELLVLGDLPLNVVVQNYSDSSFIKVKEFEEVLDTFNNLENLRQTLNQSSLKIRLYPGNVLNEILINSSEENNLVHYINQNILRIENGEDNE